MEVVHAFNANGTIKWTTTQNIYSTPIFDNNGSLYIGDGKCYALDLTGNSKWTISPSNTETTFSRPVIGSDGQLYICSERTFYAVTSSGIPLWSVRLFDGVNPTAYPPVLGPDGTAYVLTTTGNGADGPTGYENLVAIKTVKGN